MNISFNRACEHDVRYIYTSLKERMLWINGNNVIAEETLNDVYNRICENICNYTIVRCDNEIMGFYCLINDVDNSSTSLADFMVSNLVRDRGVGNMMVRRLKTESALPLTALVYRFDICYAQLLHNNGFVCSDCGDQMWQSYTYSNENVVSIPAAAHTANMICQREKLRIGQ